MRARGRALGGGLATCGASPGETRSASMPRRCALIIQDMQNDVVMEGGAFAASGSPQHCKEQNALGNVARLARRCRELGVPVIHVHFLRRRRARRG